MKFAHEYQVALEREGFPAEWVKSAISYRHLKKCIKQVQRELASIGLDAQTLSHLLDAVENDHRQGPSATRNGNHPAPFQYSFDGNNKLPRPRLLFIVDTEDGVLLDARLSPETKDYLQRLAASQRRQSNGGSRCSAGGSLAEAGQIEPGRTKDGLHRKFSWPALREPLSDPTDGDAVGPVEEKAPIVERIEIPLRSDSEFFLLLRTELSNLDELQGKEQAQISGNITEVGKTISTVTAPTSRGSTTDLYRWRELFELYVDANVFFSTNEQDGGSRSSAEAAKQLQWFSDEARKRGLDKNFKRKQSTLALQGFMTVNAILLRNLKFQEINHTAMIKILKKFDKRTALSAKTKFPELVQGDAFLARTMAKAICFKVSEEILSSVPQLNDYLCPICFNISFKPIRLNCQHVFCIRCMVTMQRQNQKHCPLCRGDVVMSADSANLDPALVNFLKTYFPNEVKAKQRENEHAAAVDKYGEDYTRCSVM